MVHWIVVKAVWKLCVKVGRATKRARWSRPTIVCPRHTLSRMSLEVHLEVIEIFSACTVILGLAGTEFQILDGQISFEIYNFKSH